MSRSGLTLPRIPLPELLRVGLAEYRLSTSSVSPESPSQFHSPVSLSGKRACRAWSWGFLPAISSISLWITCCRELLMSHLFLSSWIGDRGYGISLFCWELWGNQISIQLLNNVSLHPLYPFWGPGSSLDLFVISTFAQLVLIYTDRGKLLSPSPPSSIVAVLSPSPAVPLSLSP